MRFVDLLILALAGVCLLGVLVWKRFLREHGRQPTS